MERYLKVLWSFLWNVYPEVYYNLVGEQEEVYSIPP